MTTLDALRAIERKEKLDQSTIKQLHRDGYVEVRDVTNMQSSEKEFLVTFLTEKARKLLEGAK